MLSLVARSMHRDLVMERRIVTEEVLSVTWGHTPAVDQEENSQVAVKLGVF